MLSERLDRLAADGDPDAVALLRPYLSALRDGAQPWSVLNWMTVSRGYDTLRELVAGTVPLSHRALDDLDRGQSTRYLRAALVRHGALPSRNDADALTAWIAREIARLPESEDRTHLCAFATWQVQHDLQRRAQRCQTKRSSHRLARTHIRVAAALICWLHARDLTLRDLRQEHLDTWLAEGASTRRRQRAFIAWARRGGIVGPLYVPALSDRGPGDPLDDDVRLGIISRLLTDDEIDLRDRVAGCLVLVFAQPISRLVLLRTDDVVTLVRGARLSGSFPGSCLAARSAPNGCGYASRHSGFGAARAADPRCCALRASYQLRSSPICSASPKAQPTTGFARPAVTGPDMRPRHRRASRHDRSQA